MGRKLYISDLHLGHENVIRHDGRPFSNSSQMNEYILSSWNDKINNDDEVYILGDFCWKNKIGLEYLPKLKGIKYLVRGNHDKVTDEMNMYFQWVKDYALIRDNNEEVILSHYPIAHWYNQYRHSVHLYGHVHNTKDETAFSQYRTICSKMNIPFECYNVGCMMPYINYTPCTLEEIRHNYSAVILKEGT